MSYAKPLYFYNDSGSSGQRGHTGERGPTGASGQIGFTGQRGDTGASGQIGFTGQRGDTGASGQIGFTGQKGDTGASGQIGFTGQRGDTGASGQIGFTGQRGDTGASGQIGFTGQKGDTGPTGTSNPNADAINITDINTNSTFYPTFVSATTGNLRIYVDTTLTYNPFYDTLTTGTENLSGNLNFTGSGNRITADFSTATITNRTHFQTSTTNAATSVGAIPNGTSTTATFLVSSNSNPTNTSSFNLSTDGTTNFLNSSTNGTGTLLPIEIRMNSNPAMSINISSICNFNNVPTCSTSASTTNQLVNWNNFTSPISYDPVLQDSGGNKLNSGNYTTRVGRYIQIGNLVWVQVHIKISAKGGLDGNGNEIQITLPRTASNITDLSETLSIGVISGMSTNIVTAFGFISTGKNYLEVIIKTSASTGTSPATVGDISTSFQIKVGGFYFT